MSKEYNINRSSGQCVACQKVMVPQEEFVATLRETAEDFLREDYCQACWQANPREGQADILGAWHGRIPQPSEKKKVFIDDEMLVNLFSRLEDAAEPAKINFRFVLALVLMRKRMLVYDKMEKADGLDVWRMHFKGSDQPQRVVDPHLDEEKISEVSSHLGEILQGEL